STTAILCNLPGESSSVMTALDGYQMARAGRAGAALAIAAIGSFIAGCFATVVIALAAKPMSLLALKFGAADYFSLMVLGLIAAIVIARGSVLKSLVMVLIGIGLGTVGTDVVTGQQRFTLGIAQLSEGISFVALAMGLFGIAEIMRNLETGTDRSVAHSGITSLLPARDEIRQAAPAIARGTVIGSVLGVLPGGGAILSSFVAYVAEKRLARDPSRFGQGAIQGVAGPESANNAGAQTSFIPMLTPDVPSNPIMALMVGALMIQGIQPGPNIISKQPELFWGVIASMWLGNLMLLVINLPLIGVWVRMLRVEYRLLFPAILLVCSIGVYAIGNSVFDVYLMAGFGLFGYLLVKAGCEPAPLILGFVLGPMLEENLRRALMLSSMDPAIFVERPLSAALLAVAAVMLAMSLLPALRRRRAEVFAADD
ncbi:MAG: tripartite tricarboxylate transporter permease, partial [Burkholderiales bacterium]|nr:tripartite tricarboxylate transporter permease [Burkholderiales bacterium]